MHLIKTVAEGRPWQDDPSTSLLGSPPCATMGRGARWSGIEPDWKPSMTARHSEPSTPTVERGGHS